MVFGDIFCCYPFSLDFVQRVGPGTSTQGLHSCIPLLSVRVSSLCSPGPSLCLTKHGIRALVFYLSSSSRRRAQCIAFGRGECVWIWRGFHAMDLATSSTSQWIRLRSRQLRAQLALTIYTFLPVLIMTSTLVTVYFASCIIEGRTSTYGFLLCAILLGATLFI